MARIKCKFRAGTLVRHRKTGGIYRIAFDRRTCRLEANGKPAYAYFPEGTVPGTLPDETHPVWVRDADEMEDGRFARVRSVRSWEKP